MSKFTKILEVLEGDDQEQLDEAEIKFTKGSELSPELQKQVKAQFVHRHTGDNKPAWAIQNKAPLHFKNDKEWLENTHFAVTKKGDLHKGTKYCNSNPTFPNNPELRKKDVKESLNEGIDFTELGEKIISLFHLKVDKSGKVSTAYGNKTAEGVGRAVVTMVEKG